MKRGEASRIAQSTPVLGSSPPSSVHCGPQRTWSPRQRSAPVLRRLRDRSRPHLRKRGEAISCKLAAESYDRVCERENLLRKLRRA
eukprot:scaffold122038_cov64-Phaeocystis_antarctica.AAC.8